MFYYSSSRNHRSKGSNVKRILQVAVLLAVACWLIYQVKHSREKKTEYTGTDEVKLSKVGEEIYLGRKGDAGSENVVIIDTNAKGSDESTGLKEDVVQHDASLINNEDNFKEIPHNPELADSQESKPEQQAHSHASDGEEILHLPSEKVGDDSSDQNGNSNEGSRNIEENEHLKINEKPEDVKNDLVVGDGVEVAMTGEETTSNPVNQTENRWNGEMENEETSSDAGSQEASVNDEASKGNGVDTYEHSSSLSDIDNKIEDHTGDDARSDDAHVSSSQSHAASTNDQVDDTFMVNSQSDTKQEPEATGLENLDANKEASKEGEVETQLGHVSEVENIDNNSLGEINTNSESEKVIENSSSNIEAQNSSYTSGIISVESQADKASEQESSSEVYNNEVVELQANNEDGGKAGNSQNNSLEPKNETENPEKEINVGDSVESQEKSGGKSEEDSDDATQKEGSIIKEGKNEAALTDEAITSSEVDVKISSDDLSNEIPAGDAIQAEGGNNSEAESTNGNNNDESKAKQSFNMETQQQGEVAEHKAVQ